MNKQPKTAAGQRRRRLRQLFSMAILAVALIGQEVVCRFIFPLPEVVGFNRINYQRLAPGDPRSRPAFRRGLVYERLKFESRPDGFSEVHRLNLYGFREGDFTIELSPGRRRILVLGDSIVEGQGAAESATISSNLIRLLSNEGTPAEVINLGVVAASLSELTPLARDSISLLKPTDVILVLYANDLPAPPYPSIFDLPAPAFPRQVGLWRPRLPQLIVRAACDEPIYRRWPAHAITPFFLPVPDAANPWTAVKDSPPGVDPALYQAMTAGSLNPWLWHQALAIPGMLSHDFSRGDGSPARYLKRIASLSRAANAHLVVAYVPFCGVASGRYAPSLVKLGMEQSIAESLYSDPIYRRQNEILIHLCSRLAIPLAETTEVLVRAETEGTPQYWSFDTHPRPSGYATIAGCIYQVWRQSLKVGGG